MSCNVNCPASDLYSTLKQIRYNQVGAGTDDTEAKKEIKRLPKQALERAKKIQGNIGKG